MSYATLIFSGLSSLTLCLALTPALRNLARRLGWVDEPDLDRKLHEVAVPRIGGVPVVVACMASLGVLVLSGALDAAELQGAALFGLQVLPASILILITGILDDLIGLRPLQKLLGQCMAAFLACLAGLRFNFWNGSSLGSVWEFALTFAWLVACSNAFNLIDGIDGLAAGLGFIAASTMLFVALSSGNVAVGILSASMAGALLGFLYFNFNPASIFLGDSGSLWTGFMLGCFGLAWFEHSATLPSKIAPAIVLAVPLTDMTLSIIRRFVSEKPVFMADHGHIHHRLLDRFLVPRRVTLGLYGVSIVASIFALALGLSSELAGYGIAVVFCFVAWAAIRSLAYDEFRILGSLIRSIRSTVRYHLLLLTLEGSLKKASSPEACWFVLLRAGREFGFSGITLQLGGRHFEESGIDNQDDWTLRIPLSVSDYLNLTRRCDSVTAGEVVTSLANVFHRALSEKAIAFKPTSESDRRKMVVHGMDLYST